MRDSDFEFYVDPLAHGRVTPRAMLSATGTITAPFCREFLVSRSHILIARLAGAGWFLNIGYHDGEFVVQRNGAQIRIDEKWCATRNLPSTIITSWQEDALLLSFGDRSNHWDHEQLVEFSPIVAPPTDLVRWVRAQELQPVEAFKSEQDFLLRAHSALQRFEERIHPILNREVFWDLSRKDNKVLRRTPKREIEIQSLVHALLVDHMQLSNIDLLPETRSPAGTVDFLFSTALVGGVNAKLCVEFKNAHGRDLFTGLSAQLREYMKSLGIENGAYCVLDYRGSYFQRPRTKTSDLLAKLEREDAPFAKWPGRPVKIHWLRIGELAGSK